MLGYDIKDLGYDSNLDRSQLSGDGSFSDLYDSSGVGSFDGGLVDLTETVTAPGTINNGGLVADIQQTAGFLRSGKLTFTDTTNGYIMGIDPSDDTFKFYMGTTGNSIDWNVTTANTLTISGTVAIVAGSLAGLTITATALTATSGGNTTIVSSGATAFTAGPTGSPTFTVTQAGVTTMTSAVVGLWNVNTTSIYTGTEDHGGYTANAGDITIYSNGTDASIHAFKFYIDSAGVLNATAAIIAGAITASSGSITGAFSVLAGLTVGASGTFSSGQTAYDTGTGWWMEYNAGTPRMSLGNSAGNKLTWNGSALAISGAITGSTLDIGGSDATSFHVDTDGNMWLGAVLFANGVAKISNAGAATFTSITLTTNVVLSGLQAGSSVDGTYLAALSVGTASIANLAVTDAKIDTLAVSKLTAGMITSKSINLAVADGTGDVEIRTGIASGDFANAGAANGFILGVDDSDSNLAKFYLGNVSNYLYWNGSVLNIAGSLAVGSVPGLPTDDLLFGHWGMDEGSGLTVVDLSGNARTGTGVGTTYAQGIVNQGLSFNGTDYVSIAGAASLPTAAITVSIWVKATAPGDVYRIIWHAWAAAGDWILYSDATNWVWGVRDATNTQRLVSVAHGGSTTWHHLVGTYDGATSRFYVDGVEVGTALSFAVALNTGGTFRLSHDAFNTFQGTMDECAIYTSALTANNVKALFTNPSGNANSGFITTKGGLIGSWTIGATTLANGTNIILDASNKSISINDSTFGNLGIQIQYNTGTPRMHVGTTTKYLQFDGTNVNFTQGVIDGTSTVNGSTATNVQYRSEAFFTEDRVFKGDHNDGFTEAGSGHTITRTPLCTIIEVSGTSGNTGRVFSGILGQTIDDGVLDWNDNDWEFYTNVETSATTNQDAFWGFFDRNSSPPDVNATDVDRHIGFYVQDATLYASNANGTNQTKTDVSSGITLTNNNSYRFVYDAGVNIKFYVNDTLVATHSTNMPTSSVNDDPILIHHLQTAANEAKTLEFKNNYIAIARD